MVLLVWSGVVWLSCLRYQPLRVVAANCPPNEFSAERAREFMERLFHDGEPHPAGGNREFRERIVREFESLGYKVEQQSSTSERANWRYEGPLPLPLMNLLVTHPDAAGRQSASATPLIVAGHFDSHPLSPGVADDGVAIAISLEIARMLRDRPIPGLMFVLTDGEEFGLLGARSFVEKNRQWQRPVVINLEARGTSGPSLMFETSSDSGWLVELFAKNARRPFTSSLFYEIYKFLPNDTDFTIYKNAGWRGINLAFIGNVRNYHTPDDNLENLDFRSLQHQGENAWRFLQAVSQTDRTSTAAAAVYFDWLGFAVVRWPANLSIWLALLTCGICLVAFTPDFHKPGRAWRGVLPGLPRLLLVLAAMLAAGWLVQKGLTLDGVFDNFFPNYPVPVALTFWLWPLTAALGCLCLPGGTTDPRRLLAAVWGMWCALAVITSFTIAGCSYLFIAPLLPGSIILALFRHFADRGRGGRFTLIAATTGALAAGLIWLPLERLFYDAVGFSLGGTVIVRVAVVLSMLAPGLAQLTRNQQTVALCIASAASVATTVCAVLLN
jgi:hypothetical protein